MGLCIDFLQPKEEESWQRLTAVSSSIFAFVVHSAQLVQWILHNLKSTQLPPDYDKNPMIENYTKKFKMHRRAHRFAPPRRNTFRFNFSPILSVIWSRMYCTCFPPLKFQMLLTKLQC